MMIEVSAERAIEAPAEAVYDAISDMEQHPRFLPPAFSEFRIEEGRRGAGTITSFQVTTGGRTRGYRMQVEEPEPGRVLIERDLGSSLVTTFTVEPAGATSRVRVSTTWEGAGGVGGFFERLFAPRVMRGLYADELERLNDYVRTRGRAG